MKSYKLLQNKPSSVIKFRDIPGKKGFFVFLRVRRSQKEEETLGKAPDIYSAIGTGCLLPKAPVPGQVTVSNQPSQLCRTKLSCANTDTPAKRKTVLTN